LWDLLAERVGAALWLGVAVVEGDVEAEGRTGGAAGVT
jgi:hypothetical protein